jgi:TonB family protein
VPPRLLTVLHEVRREMLPDIARKSYADIRAQLTERQPQTVPALERIVRMASDPDVSGVEGMEDLRLLADGFLTLARAAAPPPPPSAPAATGTTSPAKPAPAERPIYTAADTDVVGPQTLDQTMPPFYGNRTSRTGLTFSGYVRVLIDESGVVESVALLRAIHPLYDQELLEAAANWRFTPAQKDGRPVRYLKVVRVIIKDL